MQGPDPMTIKTYKQNLIETLERLIRNKQAAIDRATTQLNKLQATMDEIKAETAYDDGPAPQTVKKAPSRR